MLNGLRTCIAIKKICKKWLGVLILMGILISPAHADEVFSLTLDSKPFSQYLCDKPHKGNSIRIKAARHHDLVFHRIPGQYVPDNPPVARSKDYTHFILLRDISNGALPDGAIAFRNDRAVIFTKAEPLGISRQAFMRTLPAAKQPIAIQTLNTFLRLQPIIGAATDTCRPYPPIVTYGTDDEIDRIEAGRSAYRTMIEAYNKNPTPQQPLFIHEAGMSDGFFDPEAGQQTHVSYQALNPLSFYVPPGQNMAGTHPNLDGPR